MRVLWVLPLLLAGCASTPAEAGPDLPLFELITPAFIDGRAIPEQYTCFGDNHSFGLNWRLFPAETTHMALVMTGASEFVHWIWWDVPTADLTATPDRFEASFAGGMDGRNDFGEIGYGGPCPQDGKQRYLVEMFALPAPIGLPTGANSEDAQVAIRDAAVAVGRVVGTVQG